MKKIELKEVATNAKKITKYNGWKNYETWNVMMFLGLEGIEDRVREEKPEGITDYRSLVEYFCLENSFTGDNVHYLDSSLDYDEIDSFVKEWICEDEYSEILNVA